MNKFRYPFALFLASFVMLMIGLLLKIMHWPGGQLITGSAGGGYYLADHIDYPAG